MDILIPSYKNKAVWHSLVKHINYMLELDVSVVLYFTSNERINEKEIKSFFIAPVEIIYCSGNFNLVFRCFRSGAKCIYVTTVFDVMLALPARVFAGKKLIFWVQGIIAEEDYLQFNSRFRYRVFSWMEKLSMRICNKFVFVSTAMKTHFECKYGRPFTNSIVVPCISELKHRPLPRITNSYVYIGGLSAWQKFDEILNMFNFICANKPESRLFVVTFSAKKASIMVDKIIEKAYTSKVRVLTINDRDDIAQFLSQMEYGFLLRDDTAINHVASPIKFAEYLSCGVNPIISSSLKSYAALTEKYNAGIVVDQFELQLEQVFRPADADLALLVSSRYFTRTTQLCRYRMLIKDVKSDVKGQRI